MKVENVFGSIPEDLDDEIFDVLVQNKNIKIERIISRGHTSPATGWYDQDENEWILLLKGSAILTFESDGDIHLNKGNHINIPAHTRHKVKWTDPGTETIWIAVHYSD